MSDFTIGEPTTESPKIERGSKYRLIWEATEGLVGEELLPVVCKDKDTARLLWQAGRMRGYKVRQRDATVYISKRVQE